MNEILSEGLAMMLIGMGTVLIFLCILILCMKIMSWTVSKINLIFPEPVPQTASKQRNASASDESEIAAAIIAAMFGRK